MFKWFTFFYTAQLKVKQTGVNIQKFVPDLQKTDATLDKFFLIVHPQVKLTIFANLYSYR